MDKATEIAHRIIPSVNEEWSYSPLGRAIALEHATNIIGYELEFERRRCWAAAKEESEMWQEGESGWAACQAIMARIENLEVKE